MPRRSSQISRALSLSSRFRDAQRLNNSNPVQPPHTVRWGIPPALRLAVWRKQNFTVKLWFLPECQLERKGWLVRANPRGTITFETSEQRRGVLLGVTFLLRSSQAGGITL